jgi:tyrosinase
LYPLFSYQYEACSPTAQAGQRKLSRSQLRKFLEKGAPSKLEFVRKFELRQSLSPSVGTAVSATIAIEPEAFRPILEAGGKSRAVLTVDEVTLPSKNDFSVRVFVNKPDASPQTPLDDPHYAGNFAFFSDPSMKGMATHPKPGYLVDVTPTLRALSRAGSLSSQVSMSFVLVPYERREAVGAGFTLQRLVLGIARF